MLTARRHSVLDTESRSGGTFYGSRVVAREDGRLTKSELVSVAVQS